MNEPAEPAGSYFEGWTLLAALATQTERIRVGVLVSSNTFRHPALLAHEAITVDHVSNGRLELGFGAGWYAPEHERFGIPFPAPGELVSRFREAVRVVDGLLRNEVTTYKGRYYDLKQASLPPTPVQKPRPPLTIAAHKRRMLRICAEYADSWNSFGSAQEMRERSLILDEECAAIGRDPHEITRSLYAWVKMLSPELPSPFESVAAFEDVVGRYREVGINEFILEEPCREQFSVLERIAADVIPQFRRNRPGDAKDEGKRPS